MGRLQEPSLWGSESYAEKVERFSELEDVDNSKETLLHSYDRTNAQTNLTEIVVTGTGPWTGLS